MTFKAMKFKVDNEEHSRKIQETLFDLGYRWSVHGGICSPTARLLYTNKAGVITWSNSMDYFEEDVRQEYIIEPVTKYEIKPVKRIDP